MASNRMSTRIGFGAYGAAVAGLGTVFGGLASVIHPEAGKAVEHVFTNHGKEMLDAALNDKPVLEELLSDPNLWD